MKEESSKKLTNTLAAAAYNTSFTASKLLRVESKIDAFIEVQCEVLASISEFSKEDLMKSVDQKQNQFMEIRTKRHFEKLSEYNINPNQE